MAFQSGQSGNPAGRPKGSINKQLAMLRQAVEQVLPLVVERALAGDADAQKLILERGLPKLKPVDAPVEFTLPEAGETSPERAVLQQAAEGVLSLSSVKEIMDALAMCPAENQNTVQVSAHPENAYLYQLVKSLS